VEEAVLPASRTFCFWLALALGICACRTEAASSGPATSGSSATGAAHGGAGASGDADGGSDASVRADSSTADGDGGRDSGRAGSAGTGGVSAAPDASASDADTTDAAPLDAAPVNNDCLDGLADYESAGPFAFETEYVETVRLWLPGVPDDCKVPVLSFTNGTGAACSTYAASFEHLASHGFLVACYETPNTGDGTRCEQAIATAFAAHPELADDSKIGVSGHVQGGGSAFLCVLRAEQRWASATVAGHGIQPEHGYGGMGPDWQERYGQIRAPMFMFHGTEAGSSTIVRQGLELLDPSIETYWYAAVGAPYIPIPAAWINESAVAWFRWQLLGDNAACSHVRETMPASDLWDLQEQRNPRDCD
jgi:hypothetical protein